MPINEALFAAMKAASYIKPNAGKSYKLQRVAEELIAKQAPDNPKCRVEDAFAPMADGYAVPLRVFTPLVAYGAPLPEALEESSANGTPVASAISAILPAVLPKVLPKILIKESTSSGNADGISGNANTELPSVTPRGTILFFHGGGWTTGGINLYTQACAHMAVRLQRRVISVEYRLAPEYRFPTAVEDCYEVARQLFAGELPISGVGGSVDVDHPQSAAPTAPASGGENAAVLPLAGAGTRSVTGGGAATISTSREAIGSTQTLTAMDAIARAQATRERNTRQETTGRVDLLAPIAPVPREIIVPIEPSRRAELESWLTDQRGGAVTIRVASRGDKKQLMDRANENANQALQRSKMSRISDMGARTQAMNDVAKALGLNQAPLRIECYDISNTVGGAFQVASMVVFEDAIAKKSEYRRFSIRGKDGQGAVDDLSALYETLTRRFKHGNIAGDSGESIDAEQRAAKAEQQQEQSVSDANGTSSTTPAAITDASSFADSSEVVQQNTNRHHFAYKPNLVVVDGGKPQVMAAAKALKDCGVDDVAVCGLAKRLEEVWVPDDDYPIILKRQSEGMYLLQRVRDESHRFAITYHRQQRRKGALRSALDEIPGIGESYQKRLLNHFGSVKAMRMASVEDFEQVKGVGHAKAEALYAALHDE